MTTDGKGLCCDSCNGLDPVCARRVLRWLRYQIGLLPYRPRLLWRQGWLRSDEFHSSLDMDIGAMLRMNQADRGRYLHALARRRNAAHERDLAS